MIPNKLKIRTRLRPLSTAIEPRDFPCEQALVRTGLLRYSFRSGFEPRDGRIPLAGKMAKQKA